MTEAQKMLAELISRPEPLQGHEIRKCVEMLYEDGARRLRQRERGERLGRAGGPGASSGTTSTLAAPISTAVSLVSGGATAERKAREEDYHGRAAGGLTWRQPEAPPLGQFDEVDGE